ncbi:hypothetical protein niasHS_016715 [Heterodera schachtii]|uniref:B30.2/SPRY domain-containing protein n=1 Tax=Heterodera schachtii TaxID=97005 RepID=A0ABD2HXJ5_HETSC
MSISTNSINCGDDLTPAENGEVNGNAISLDNDGQFDGKNSESITDQQQLKEFREKFAKMEMELKMAKLELENKALEQKLKHQEMMVEQKTLKEKGTKIEQEKEKNAILPNLSTSEEMSVLIARIAELNRAKTIEPSVASSELFGQDGYDWHHLNNLTIGNTKGRDHCVSEDLLKVILERIGELEKQQQQQSKAAEERFLQSQNNQKKILKRIFSELEKQTRKKALFRKNCWNAFACHKDIEIIGDKSLIVHHKGNLSGSRCSVVAKYPIVLNKHLSDFFYYEISVQKKRTFCVSFGFADKQQTELDGIILCEKGTYTYESDSDIWINGKRNGTNAEYSYGVGDTVGIGVHFASRQMIFTKNGLLLDTADFLFDPSFADGSFYPFVTLFGSGDKIEANFGPNFKFDLETL